MAASTLTVDTNESNPAGLCEAMFAMMKTIRILEDVNHEEECRCVLCDSADGMLFTLRMYNSLLESEVLMDSEIREQVESIQNGTTC